MKKLILLTVVALMSVLLLAACGSGASKEVATTGESKEGNAEQGVSGILDTIKQRDKIVFGVKHDTKLFGLKDPATGEVAGFDIDIARQIAKEILGDENKAEFVEVTSKTRIPLLNKGDIDAIVATMTITEERKKEVDFSNVYFEAGQSLLVKKGSPVQSIEDLTKDTPVLAVKGSTSTINIRNAAPDAPVLEFENYAEAFTALKAGQGVALTTDNAILLGMASEDNSFELVGGTFTDEPYGIAVKKGNTELVDAINGVLDTLKSNGEYDAIYKKWFDLQ
ncbi:transporter substrate-binding domain-containing protein [Schinkia azotoformans]|uniref:Glutamine ABC transporter glutamine-binding lipoprotein n=1 Tax=Schinkia azotoformans LMG 9581 TaxID=1131731 RepID=K6D6U1_SCHAZ|nr:transporter substrate-binding domain-containing protein [Schinkia azotoformans]EKN68242.1 glutamine ABC transporter glutamine-binding lipoprotein [Schinkia azotoformans LMG 9581]MEC1639594.1 transporter substrate-binding domain-containing protein [Schinkia azotoformans]MEC1947357.1 transporter substrate-binding domain-containing protein [Schinkia azotoformans]MED4350782.1 transporter substrate-binding domain-containing protein [Schinkia azotoformans]